MSRQDSRLLSRSHERRSRRLRITLAIQAIVADAARLEIGWFLFGEPWPAVSKDLSSLHRITHGVEDIATSAGMHAHRLFPSPVGHALQRGIERRVAA